jgi:hypothetical protein
VGSNAPRGNLPVPPNPLPRSAARTAPAGAASASAPARARHVSLALAIPAWGWLVGLVLTSVGIRYGFARRMVAPWIMVDELIYSELAKSFASQGHFLIRGVHHGSYGVVYPLLVSPAYRAFGAVPDAYAAAKAINSVLMSLATVPAYFLARRVVRPAMALLAAVLTVAVPSTLYAGTLMTENAFYPIFLCVALALVLCLERPTITRQLVLLALCLLAYETRTQALALGPAVLTAPLLLGWYARRPLRETARAFAFLWGLVLGGGVLVLAVQSIRGRSVAAALGSYETVGHQHYTVGAVLKWLLYHVAELDLYLGLLPFAALLLLAALGRQLPRTAQAFVAASVPLTAWLLLEVAAFASLPTVQRVEERNMFYVAPLAFVALCLWLELGLPRPSGVTIPVALVAVALPALLPYPSLIGVQVQSDTLELLPWWWVQDHWIALGQVRWAVLGCASLVGAAFLQTPRRLALALPAFVVAYYAVTLAPIENGLHGMRMASLGALFQGNTTGRRDWIDAAVGRHADVSVVRSGRTDAFTLWENEFFNRSVGRVFELANPLGGGLPATQAVVDQRTGELFPRAEAEYALTDDAVPLEGTVVARDAPKQMVLLRVDGPLRETQLVSGVYPDTWSENPVRYTRLRCSGGSVAVDVSSDPHLFRAPQTLTAISTVVRRFRIRPTEARTVRVPLRPMPEQRCVADFTVTPTAVPGNGDTRVLGLHFNRFTYSP